MMSKNVVILIGLLVTWLLVVRMNSSSSLNSSSSESVKVEREDTPATDGFGGSGGAHEDATTQSLTTMSDNNYVKVSKQNAVNTKSMYTDNTDLEPFGRSYTS